MVAAALGPNHQHRILTTKGPFDFRRGRSRKSTPAERFARMVRANEATGCVLWLGSKTLDGYGKFRVDGKNTSAHRWAYEQAKGPIPPGMHLDHLCRQRSCVNADHLEAVTPYENTLRGDHVAAIAAHRQTCARGHPWTDASTYRRGRYGRSCRTCGAENKRRQQQVRRHSVNGEAVDRGPWESARAGEKG
ncbi:MAG TPA: HNH endonuclease signature motif containing protein [Dehalococcoidia bacterium]|jgi:hypothetical protein|nr:HNH endonuclease signature motif containing protein [Dehalococcoidia bacterium]